MDTHPATGLRLKTLLLSTDLAGFVLAHGLAASLRLQVFNISELLSSIVIFFALIDLTCLYLLDLYHLEPQTPLWKKPLQTLIAIFLAGCIIVLVAYLVGAVEFSGQIGRGVLIGSQVLFALWAASFRFVFSKLLRRVTARARWLVVGTSDYLDSFVRDLTANQMAGYFALLTPDSTQPNQTGSPSGEFKIPEADSGLLFKHLGTWGDLPNLTKESWSGIVVCAGNNLPEDLVEVLMDMRLQGVRVVDLTDFYEQTWYKVPVFYLQRSWFAMSNGFQLLHNPIGLRLKRIFDVIGACALLILTFPVLLLTALAIKLESRGPAVFRQTRVGEGGKLFTVYKLRSMRTDAETGGAQWAAKNDARVTRVGTLIRATRVDELPQLINVVRGDMSFIGPRPERPEFTGTLEEQIPYYSLRHILRPGVTGWAQVMYPYGASVEDAKEKLQFELYYIKNYSLLLDAAIVLKTVRVVLFGQGR